MSVFVHIFQKNILPAFIVIATGVLIDRKLEIDKHSFSRTAIYILTPCLVFSSIVESNVNPSQFGIMIVYVGVITLIMCAIPLAVGKLLGWEQRSVDALVLSVAFLNAGNFGLSVVFLSYGDAGLELATVFFVGTNLAVNTLAAFFAARGNGGGRKALMKVFKLPGPYAFALALLIRFIGIDPPYLLMRPVSLIGQASVPILLLMLGIQLSQAKVGGRYGQVAVGVFLRLVVGSVMALLLAPIMGLQGLARKVAVVEASTPTAVNSGLMAIEFEADADYVSSVIFFSTLFSGVTLTILMYLLGT